MQKSKVGASAVLYERSLVFYNHPFRSIPFSKIALILPFKRSTKEYDAPSDRIIGHCMLISARTVSIQSLPLSTLVGPSIPYLFLCFSAEEKKGFPPRQINHG